MATKLICDICGKNATETCFIWDGGTQIDPPSGRMEETGDNYDFCLKCYMELFAKTYRKIPEAGPIFSKLATEALGKRWRGKDAGEEEGKSLRELVAAASPVTEEELAEQRASWVRAERGWND